MLNPGTRLGPYEIVAPLGAGGMGEVYRARDTRLGRDVAVKVLPHHLSDNAEVRARFEREARTVSGLNHPNICALFDVGREGATDYIVMELVEGETLARRLARGPLATHELFRTGAQIADALDRAHRAGVIHRDLKPANVMLARGGAKLMDFGLARATGLAPTGGVAGATLTQSPTMAQPLTAEGTIVGTFQYMAPEQLEGRETDARSDLWAFGVMLYEMATGKRPFEGRSQASLIGSIMNAQPVPMSQLAPLAPPALERLVAACLAKDPDERIQTAHDAKLQLEWSAAEASGASPTPALARSRRSGGARLAWAVAAALALVGAALGVALVVRVPRGLGLLRVAMTPPPGVTIDDEDLHTAISPDGGRIVFVGTDSSGVSQLWLRDLASPAATPLPGTVGAFLPFWSPDSRLVAFFAQGKLQKIDLASKTVELVCAAPDGRGGAWNRAGTIVFAPASTGGLSSVPASGGDPHPLAQPDSARGEHAFRFPSFLPDGEHFLFAVLSDRPGFECRIGSLHEHGSQHLLDVDGAAVYAAPGHIMYNRSGVLVVQHFDTRARRLTGAAIAVSPSPGVSRYSAGPPGSVSATGVIAQRNQATPPYGLAWYDREGRRIGTVPMPADAFVALSLAPDDAHAALVHATPSGDADIWSVELARGLTARMTTDLVGCERPIWSPDGRMIYFSCFVGGHRDIMRVAAAGEGRPESYWKGRDMFADPLAWFRDGRTLVTRDLDPATGEDIWAIHDDQGRKRTPVLTSRFHEEDASPSPDGRWIAYRSDESGRDELYVQSYPDPSTKVRISADGAGTGPRSNTGRPYWRRDGRELVYVSGDGVSVMSVPIEPGPGFRFGSPRLLFRLPAGASEIVPASDCQRFLLLEQRASAETGSVKLIVNWPVVERTR